RVDIYNDGHLRLTNSTLTFSWGVYGGGIYNVGTLTLTNSTISGNHARIDAGGISNDGTLSITHSTLFDNSTAGAPDGGGGGGISNYGALTLTNSTLAYNTVYVTCGGGIASYGTLTITNSTLSGNVSWRPGGGICGQATLQNTILALNRLMSGPDSDCYGSATSRGHNLIGNLTGCRTTLRRSDLTGAP